MRGITVTYSYDGDEAAWRQVISDFLQAVAEDSRLAGRFLYQVAVADDGKTRFHWGRWDSPETLAHLQAQPFFATFAARIREFAGGVPRSTGHDTAFRSAGW